MITRYLVTTYEIRNWFQYIVTTVQISSVRLPTDKEYKGIIAKLPNYSHLFLLLLSVTDLSLYQKYLNASKRDRRNYDV